MNTPARKNAVFAVQSLCTALAFIALCIPSFGMTGAIIKPLLICIVGSAAISAIACSFRRSADVVGTALLITVCFWLAVALIMQLKAQIAAGWTNMWIYIFYFDKLLIVGTVWLIPVLFFLVMRLFRKTDCSDYSSFFKTAGIAFVIFYAFLLLFSFVFIRLESASSYPINLHVFSTIRKYIFDYSSVPYEVFMMFCGNLFYFTPLGYIFCILLKDKKMPCKSVVLFFFPLAAFSLLELSQYLLQNGFCEIDDMLMNSIGFWVGALIYPLTNKIAVRLSKGKYSYFWN